MKSYLKINWIPLLILLFLPLAAGGISSLLSVLPYTASGYTELQKPPLSPPAAVFPIVWTVLYLMMGLAAFLIFASGSEKTGDLLFQFFVQLFVNLFWPFLFFRFQACFAAFVWLIFLWILVFHLTGELFRVRPAAGWLMVPYLLWISFAGYLNLAICLLNR